MMPYCAVKVETRKNHVMQKCSIIKYHKTLSLIKYVQKNTNIVLYDKNKVYTIIVLYYVLFIFLGWYIFFYYVNFKCKNKIMFKINNINNILLFQLYYKSKCNLTIYIEKYNYITKYIIKNYTLSLLLRKYLNFSVPYYDYFNITFERKILKFLVNKETKFIEYQINISNYFLDETYVFDHLKQHLLNVCNRINSAKMSIYMFYRNKEVPREKKLSFIRLNTSNDLVTDIIDFNICCIMNYENLCINDYYKNKCTKDHIILRLYFKPPISTELLMIDPFIYYARTCNGILVYNKINKVSLRYNQEVITTKDTAISELDISDYLTKQDIHDLGYANNSNFDFN